MPSSSDLDNILLDAFKEAGGLPKVDLDGEVLITYTWRAKPAALTLYFSLIHSGRKPFLAHSALASVHIIPYRDVYRIIAFTAEEKDARTVNLAMASSSLGIETVVVGPRMHPAIEETLDSLGSERIVVSGRSPLLTMMAASLYWRPRLMGAREERVSSEISHIESAVDWVRDRYNKEITAISRDSFDEVYHTPSIEAGAIYHSFLAGSRVYPLDNLAIARGPRKILVFVAGVDEHNYKDILLASSLKGVKLLKVLIDTDPVTLNIYSAMLSALSLKKVA